MLTAQRKPRPGSMRVKKFLVVYMADIAAFERMRTESTPEQQKAGMAAWMKWMSENQAAIVERGAPVGKTKRITASGVSDVRNEISGYSVVQAESHEAAAALYTKDFPHLQIPGGWIEVMEIMSIPGM
jgi:hypothetical protein